jgi:hypothetical protein
MKGMLRRRASPEPKIRATICKEFITQDTSRMCAARLYLNQPIVDFRFPIADWLQVGQLEIGNWQLEIQKGLRVRALHTEETFNVQHSTFNVERWALSPLGGRRGGRASAGPGFP